MASPGVNVEDATGRNMNNASKNSIAMSQSLAMQAAASMASNLQAGTSAYNAALTKAQQEMSKTYDTAINATKGYSAEAKSLNDEYLRMLGVTPSSNASQLFSPANALLSTSKDSLKAFGIDTSKYEDAVSKLQGLDTSGLNRSELKTALTSSLNDIQSNLSTKAAAALSAGNQNKWAVDKYNEIMGEKGNGLTESALLSQLASLANPAYGVGVVQAAQKAIDIINHPGPSSNDAWDALDRNLQYDPKASGDMAKAKAAQAAVGTQIDDLQKHVGDFETDWSPGYTGSQVMDKVAATPGYNFQLQQGNQGIQRQAAARGMLNSGNTLTALTQFGQGLASNYYQQNLQNLQSQYTQLAPYTNMGIQLGLQQGQNLADTTTQIGLNTYNQYAGTGQAYNQAYLQNANLMGVVGQRQQEMGFEAMMSLVHGSESPGAAAVSAGASMANAQLGYQANQNALAAGLYRSQQGYLGFSGSGSPSSYGVSGGGGRDAYGNSYQSWGGML